MQALLEMIKNKENPFNFSYINNYIVRYFEQIFDKEDLDK